MMPTANESLGFSVMASRSSGNVASIRSSAIKFLQCAMMTSPICVSAKLCETWVQRKQARKNQIKVKMVFFCGVVSISLWPMRAKAMPKGMAASI